MDNIKKKIWDRIQEADMVLVGIGEEFEISPKKMKDDLKYKHFLEKMEVEKAYRWMLPYVEKLYLKEHQEERIKKAYANLEKILAGKNYYVVSECMDDCIYGTDLNNERIVTPCGGYRFVQCKDNCSKKIELPDDEILNKIYDCIQNGNEINKIDKIERPVCGKCGKDIVFNNVKSDNYAEEGYLEQWNHYMKWLQGTVNRKLCVLELGVGLQFPTVIRWPFEKIVFLNQKAYLFRIHNKLYQLTEEIKDRGCAIKENSTDFLINWFV
ncbi:MAG: hypothetical protein GX235_11845 [Clostridiales bacterium]|nr:hypothetical protein [Clostridiales bacterium]